MKQGSIVAVNYTGKVVSTNEVFESTVEKKAIEAGIFNDKARYEPFVVIVGEGDVLAGLDKALLEMEVGEKRVVDLKPSDAWGERKPENIKIVALQHFKQKKIAPVPGLVVEVNGMQGKVQSVSGGRVRVDFNHPLAGKDLQYEINVEKELTVPKEQVGVLFSKYFAMVPDAEKGLRIGSDDVEVTLSPRYSANLGPLKELFSKMVTKHVKGFGRVRFVEEFKEEKPPVEKAGSAGKEEKAVEPVKEGEDVPGEKEGKGTIGENVEKGKKEKEQDKPK